MNIFTVVAVVLPMVFCADLDPTTVCLPDTLQYTSYELNSDASAAVYIDFTQNRLASVSPNLTIVQDLANAKEYTTDGTGACVSSDIQSYRLVTQCLPAIAFLAGTFSLGGGAGALQVQSWEIDIGHDIVRYDLTLQPTQPAIPVLVQYIVSGRVVNLLYLDPDTTIPDASVFNIPSVCPPATVV